MGSAGRHDALAVRTIGQDAINCCKSAAACAGESACPLSGLQFSTLPLQFASMLDTVLILLKPATNEFKELRPMNRRIDYHTALLIDAILDERERVGINQAARLLRDIGVPIEVAMRLFARPWDRRNYKNTSPQP